MPGIRRDGATARRRDGATARRRDDTSPGASRPHTTDRPVHPTLPLPG